MFIPNQLVDQKVEIIEDLYVGEVCSLDYENEHYICTVMKKLGSEALLSGSDLSPKTIEKGTPAKIYVFRPDVGGYLMEGVIKDSGKSAVIFAHTGRVEFRGHEHLMTIQNIKFTLTAWPEPYYASEMRNSELARRKETPPQKGKYKEELQLDGSIKKVFIPDEDIKKEDPKEQEPKEITIPPLGIMGTTTRISDRAIIFKTSAEITKEALDNQEFWEIEIELTPNFTLICNGKLTNPSKVDGFLFKFIDIDEKDRTQLYEYIKLNDGEREQLF